MIRLLDCTLRDGGYVNNWNFGYDAICNILNLMLQTNVEIVEAGFVRDVVYDKDKAVFPNIKTLDKIMADNKISTNGAEIAVMAEIANPIPLEKIEPAKETGVDIIRVIVWKTKHTIDGQEIDALEESLEYCKGIIAKGYRVCVQPNRTDQYSEDEFVRMLNMFSAIKPYAIYIVDSWGTMYSNHVMHYMKLADEILPASVRIGFHGHNNMMQVFSTAEKIVEADFNHEIILDGSVDGIGRGAGNLNLELIARYLNHEKCCNYKLKPMFEIYDTYIKPLRKLYTWGSSIPFMLSADKNVNPNYVADYENVLTINQTSEIYELMSNSEKIMYSTERAKKYLEKVRG